MIYRIENLAARKSFIKTYNDFKVFCISKEDRIALDKSHRELMNWLDELDEKGEICPYYNRGGEGN